MRWDLGDNVTSSRYKYRSPGVLNPFIVRYHVDTHSSEDGAIRLTVRTIIESFQLVKLEKARGHSEQSVFENVDFFSQKLWVGVSKETSEN